MLSSAPPPPVDGPEPPMKSSKDVEMAVNPLSAASSSVSARLRGGAKPSTPAYIADTVDPIPNALIEYVIFMTPGDLTRAPSGTGCMGKLAAKCLAALGAFEFNRLKHMRTIFPGLDGPVSILDVTSMAADNSFAVLNDLDTAVAGDTSPRKVVRVAGVVRRNVLYKRLPKEGVFVPAANWAEEVEKSEILEVVRALQLVGAVSVDFVHSPSFFQPSPPTLPPATNGKVDVIAHKLKNAMSGIGRFAKSRATAAVNSAITGTGGSPLSGRLLLRINEKPLASLEEVLEELGSDYYHLRRTPAIMGRLQMRMARGILMGDTFTLTHATPDSTTLPAMRILQESNLPKGATGTVADMIDTGYRGTTSRLRYETNFKVVYPDCKEAADGRLAGDDIIPEERPLFGPGKLHPLSGLKGWDDITPGKPTTAAAPAGGKGDAADKKAAPAGKKGDATSSSGGKSDGDAAAKKSSAAEVALKRKVFELSAESFLQRSMLDYIHTVKGVPLTQNPHFHAPNARKPAGAAPSAAPSSGGAASSAPAGGLKGKLSGITRRLNPLALLKGVRGGKGAFTAAAGAAPQEEEAFEIDGEIEADAVPSPIPGDRPSLGGGKKHAAHVAPPRGAPSHPLRAGWEAVTTDSGEVYYVNTETDETTWERPE